MPALFNVQKQVEHGTTNPMSARLTVQVINLLQACGADQIVFMIAVRAGDQNPDQREPISSAGQSRQQANQK